MIPKPFESLRLLTTCQGSSPVKRLFFLAVSVAFSTSAIAQNAREYYNRGATKQARNELDGAISDYSNALTLDPNYVKAYVNRGLAKAAKGDPDGAIADYNHALEFEPAKANVFNNRGISKKAKDDVVGALADYDRALVLDPTNAYAYNNRGNVRQIMGNADGAMADFNRALELDPKYAKAYNNRGNAKFLDRNWKGALEDYNQFFELSKRGQDQSRVFAWLIRTRLGESEAANQDLAAYLASRVNGGPNDWTSKLGSYLLGKLSEIEFFPAAKSSNPKTERAQLCEAWYYAGIKKLFAGDKSAASVYFKRCLASGQKNVLQYLFAKTELESLGQ